MTMTDPGPPMQDLRGLESKTRIPGDQFRTAAQIAGLKS